MRGEIAPRHCSRPGVFACRVLSHTMTDYEVYLMCILRVHSYASDNLTENTLIFHGQTGCAEMSRLRQDMTHP